MKLLTILVILGVSLSTSAEPDDSAAIKKSLKSILPDLDVTRIEESRIPGLYTVYIGAEVLYVSGDGHYLLRGDLVDIQSKTNLTEKDRSGVRVSILGDIPAEEFIEFAPEHPQHTIYVFTDVTCAFCQRLQSDIRDINRNGIAVRYLAFPREGTPSETAKKMESVWCSDNPQQALMDAMIGLDVDPARCDNPVARHFALGQAIGLRGTPAIYTENGRYLPGYMPPDELLRELNSE